MSNRKDFPARALAVAFSLGLSGICLASGPSTADAEKGDGSGAKYFNLRYDEDFRYFDEDEEAYYSDFRNRLKNIHAGEKWRVDFGGEFRLRWESRTNGFYGINDRTHNAQQNYRWMLHANARYGDLFRVFVQGIFAHAEDQDGPFQPTQENHGDIHQLFFDLRFLGEDVPVTFRAGRQELDYGNNRWVGALEWVSTRRRFDAVKLFYESDVLDIDAFYAKPVQVRRNSLDHYNEDVDFYGLYATYKGIDRHGLDLYFFGLDQTDNQMNPNGKRGDQDVYTLGARFWGHTGPVDYNTELAGQWGHWAGDTVQAWSWSIDLGYTFDHPWRPRVGAGFEMVTGDEDPYDGKVGTVNQLFAFNNTCLGYLDLFGRQNMNMVYAGIDAWPIKDKLKTSVTFHSFWLDADRDWLYSVSGAPVFRDQRGRSGREIGQELDIALEWVVSKNTSVWVAYSYMWAGPYVHRIVEDDENPQVFLVQFQYRF